jgi:hypothetical protein
MVAALLKSVPVPCSTSARMGAEQSGSAKPCWGLRPDRHVAGLYPIEAARLRDEPEGQVAPFSLNDLRA